MIIRLAVLSLLSVPFLLIWAGTKWPAIPTGQPGLPETEEAAENPNQLIAIDCNRPECTRPARLPFSQTIVVQTGPGYALVGVCRNQVQVDGVWQLCGRTVTTSIVSASVAAEFLHQGAKSEHPRMVSFRAELAAVDNPTEMAEAIVQAKNS